MNTNSNLNAVPATIPTTQLPAAEIESLFIHELEFVSGGSGCDNLG